MVEKLSFLDKLKILIDVTSSSGLFIVALLLVLSLAYLFATTNRKNAKSSKVTYTTIYLILVVISIILYRSSLEQLFDYMMDNLFIAIYFPNLAIYFAAIVVANIILWISIFNFKTNKSIKYINITFYSIIHYLLILIINVITNNKLDVFSQSSVYGNKEALALIELSSGIFIVWILLLIIYKVIRAYQIKHKKEKVSHKTIERKDKRSLPVNIVRVNPPQYIVDNTQTKTNNVKEETRKTNDFDKLLTLEDYKLVLSILKEQKEKEKKKQEKLELEREEKNKITELQQLYRSVR